MVDRALPIVRAARDADADAISALLLALSPAFFDDPSTELPEAVRASFSPQGCQERISDPNYQSWVVLDGDVLIGYGSIRERRHLYHLFVAQAHQKRGVARALWAEMLPAFDPGAITVRSSRVAIPVYRQFGFVERGDLESRLGLTYQLMVLSPEAGEC